MKHSHVTLLLLAFSLIFTPGSLPAQSTDEEVVVVTLTGQNYKRTVAGVVNTECGGPTVGGVTIGHSAPFGNWGVASNYGDIADTDQFRGWSHEDGPLTKLQWNSCTHGDVEFHAPNCDYYNANDCTTQEGFTFEAVVTHGRMSYRHSATACPTPGTVGNEPGNGCLALEGTQASQTSNHMTLYELDGWVAGHSGDNHDLVKTLYFPGTSVTFTSCSYEECPERTTGWFPKSGQSTDGATHAVVGAELRMKAKATLHGFCDWDAGE